RDWYSKDGNSINCKCSQQSVLVDADGNPEYTDTITKLKQEYKSMQARGYAWAGK
ncbi:phage head morphogenesis protein, partial [Enterobacter hormaechei]